MREDNLLHAADIVVIALGTILCAGVAAAQNPNASPESSEGLVLERILVKVNGEIVTQTDLESQQITTIRQRGLQAATDADLARILVEITPGVIAGVVDELLLVQQGKELGYSLGDEQFQGILDGIKEENGFGTDEELLAALQQQEGMGLPDLRRMMERQMLVSQVQQIEILQKVSITEVEAREFYDDNIEQYTEPVTVTLREVVITVAEGTAGVNIFADQQAREEAGSIRERLLSGEDFGLIAAEASDAPSKANGGLIGPIQLSEISDTIQEVIAGLEVGDLSELIRTPQGYQILKLESRTQPTPQPFDEVRVDISNNVFSDRRLAEYDKYLERLRSEAVIDWKSDELRQAYEAYREQQAAAASTSQ